MPESSTISKALSTAKKYSVEKSSSMHSILQCLCQILLIWEKLNL